MEWIIVVAVPLILGLWVTGQRRRRDALEELGVSLVAASPASGSQSDEERDVEDESLNADEVERRPGYRDERTDGRD